MTQIFANDWLKYSVMLVLWVLNLSSQQPFNIPQQPPRHANPPFRTLRPRRKPALGRQAGALVGKGCKQVFGALLAGGPVVVGNAGEVEGEHEVAVAGDGAFATSKWNVTGLAVGALGHMHSCAVTKFEGHHSRWRWRQIKYNG